jgi:Fe-S-cluster containining protein
MILSKNDVDRITKNSSKNLRKKDFMFKNKGGFFQLKNFRNHCVFLDSVSKQCRIYILRPQGCRFYPLIFNFQEKDCVFDNDCPRPHLFYQNKTEFDETCRDLSRFLKDELGLNLN